MREGPCASLPKPGWVYPIPASIKFPTDGRIDAADTGVDEVDDPSALNPLPASDRTSAYADIVVNWEELWKTGGELYALGVDATILGLAVVFEG